MKAIKFRSDLRTRAPLIAALLVTIVNTHVGNSVFADVGVSASIEAIDNPRRLATSDEDELLTTLRIDGNLQRETQLFQAALNYNATTYTYRDEILDDRENVVGLGQFTWKIRPETFNWRVYNSRSDQLIDAGLPDVSDNRQIIDITSTGPELNLPVGDANILNLRLDRAWSSFEDTGAFDQDRLTLSAGFSRILTSQIMASFNAEYRESEFRDGGDKFFEFLTAFLSINYNTTPLTVSLELGETEISRPGIVDTSNPLLRFDATFNATSRSQLFVSFSETTEDMLTDIRNSPIRASFDSFAETRLDERLGSSNQTGIFERKTQSLGYRFAEPGSFNLSVVYTADERGFDDPTGFEEDDRLSVNLNLPLSQRISVTLLTRFSKLDSSRLTASQDRREIGLRTNYRLSNGLRLNFAVRDTKQTSAVPESNYTGGSILLGLAYRF